MAITDDIIIFAYTYSIVDKRGRGESPEGAFTDPYIIDSLFDNWILCEPK